MRRILAISIFVSLVTPAVDSDEPASLGPFTLDEAVSYALLHHPTIYVQRAQDRIQRAQIAIARAAYLPHLDLSVQANVGTGNVLRGPLFPMLNIPSISGPPTGRTLTDADFGTLVGVGASWNALGLVGEIAQVDVALANESATRAGIDVQRLAVAYAAADQFMDVLSQVETVRAAQAAVERARIFATVVETLTAQELRPGADASRARAQVALAQTLLIRAEQADAVSRATLSRAMGSAGRLVDLKPGNLLTPPPASSPTTGRINPLLAQAAAVVRASEAERHVVDLQCLPRLNLLAALWVRGSGLNSGTFSPSPAKGLVPDTPNWATGLTLTWPALDLVSLRAQARAAQAVVDVARAQQTELAETVRTQVEIARETLEAARRVSTNTPVALQAARAAEAQAMARYRAGLATLDEVAQSQNLLTQAEIDDAVARLNVRRAELLLCRAIGDLTPFFAQLHAGVP